MEAEPTPAIEVFYSFAREDERLQIKLEKQLSLLRQQSIISNWHFRTISAGKEWTGEIDSYLNSAHIILLLVSPDFLASDYCYGFEMKRAMGRHEANDAVVIPVILRPVIWDNAPFSKLQALPKNGVPITKWRNQDEGFFHVAQGIQQIIKELLTTQKIFAQWPKNEQYPHMNSSYEKKLLLAEEYIQQHPESYETYIEKGLALSHLGRFEEALKAFEQAILTCPYSRGETPAKLFDSKGHLLERMNRPEEALHAYDTARSLRGLQVPSSRKLIPRLDDLLP